MIDDDIEREKKLEKDIEQMQDEKIELLGKVKNLTGLEKVKAIDDFLILNEKQRKLEVELELLIDKIYGEEPDGF